MRGIARRLDRQGGDVALRRKDALVLQAPRGFEKARLKMRKDIHADRSGVQ